MSKLANAKTLLEAAHNSLFPNGGTNAVSEQDTIQARFLFSEQDRAFHSWMRDFYRAAFFFNYLRTVAGEKKFLAWREQNFLPHEIEVIENMLDKLHNTKTGQRILETVTDPNHFVFPS